MRTGIRTSPIPIQRIRILIYLVAGANLYMTYDVIMMTSSWRNYDVTVIIHWKYFSYLLQVQYHVITTTVKSMPFLWLRDMPLVKINAIELA